MNYLVLLFCCMVLLFSNAQDNLKSVNGAGDFSLGIRSTTSFFDNTNSGLPGIGTGGDFRIRLSDRVNTDWFADYIMSTTNYLKRNDFHIGWSVMFYPFNYANKGFKPYVLAGHCFDYSQFIDLKNSCFMISSSPSLVPNLLDGSFSSNYQKLNYNIKYLRYKVLAFIAHLYFMSLRIREINWLLSD